MAERIYLVPLVGSGTEADPRRAKYFDALGARYSALDGGSFMLVVADTDNAQHGGAIANLDCRHLPFQAGARLAPGNAALLQSALAAAGRSGAGVLSTLSWEEALRLVAERLQPGLAASGGQIQMNGIRF